MSGFHNGDIDKKSNWYQFAKDMDIGKLDMETLAIEMGFKHFNDMDQSISPRSLYRRGKGKFVNAVQTVSIHASGLSSLDIGKIAVK